MNEKSNANVASIFKNGVIVENPVLRLMLGTCPTLAVSTDVTKALGMGIATMLVLICSGTLVSLLRKVIPDKVRIPCYITLIAGLTSVIQLLCKAYVPALDKSLGIFLPLIAVNCILLGRAEMFASKNGPLISMIDGIAMGVGFTAALLSMAVIREILGAGSFAGFRLVSETAPIQPIGLLVAPPGGFLVFGLLIALLNHLTKRKVPDFGCEDCPAASSCSMKS